MFKKKSLGVYEKTLRKVFLLLFACAEAGRDGSALAGVSSGF